jgi:hypothetical protein
VLGASIVGTPHIQSGVRALFEEREIEETRFTDPACVVIEVLFPHCHDPERHELRVMDVAKDVNATLKVRRENAELEARKVGEILKNLGVGREARNRQGRRILLGDQLKRNIHVLARDHQVESIEQVVPVCTLCKEILGDLAKATADAIGQDSAVQVASDDDRRDRCDR